MSRIPLALAAASVGLLAACGTTAPATNAEPQPTGQNDQRRQQTLIADCMKQDGFKYVPFVFPRSVTPAETRARRSGDHDSMKKFREKNGYGIYAVFVYPQEFHNPMVEPEPGASRPPENPNFKIRGSLSKTQGAAYDDAEDECYRKAVKEVTGKDVVSIADQNAMAEARADQLVSQQLDGEPELVELAAEMGSCLKAKGYSISSTKPRAMAQRGPKRFEDEKRPLGEKVPEDFRKRLGLPEGERYEPNLSAAEARPYLAREIKDALDDLECGKNFYPAFLPAQQKWQAAAYKEFGLDPEFGL